MLQDSYLHRISYQVEHKCHDGRSSNQVQISEWNCWCIGREKTFHLQVSPMHRQEIFQEVRSVEEGKKVPLDLFGIQRVLQGEGIYFDFSLTFSTWSQILQTLGRSEKAAAPGHPLRTMDREPGSYAEISTEAAEDHATGTWDLLLDHRHHQGWARACGNDCLGIYLAIGYLILVTSNNWM